MPGYKTTVLTIRLQSRLETATSLEKKGYSEILITHIERPLKPRKKKKGKKKKKTREREGGGGW